MIVVCGCSFSSRSKASPGTHWSELLSDRSGKRVLNLAAAGASNSHIRLQLEEAIRFSPEWVIVNSTNCHRIEIPINKNNKKDRYSLLDFMSDSIRKSAMISFPILHLAEGRLKYGSLDEEKTRAVQGYALNMFDETWKRQQDSWLIDGGISDLVASGVKVIYDDYFLIKGTERSSWKKLDKVHYVDEEHSLKTLYQRYSLPEKLDPGYHISSIGQEILANYYASKILEVDRINRDSVL